MGSFTGFLNNAALMLCLCVIYDTFGIYAISNKKVRDALTGVLVGLISIAVMLTPWALMPGVFFDTRWVLLSLCGLFFGIIPTTIAMIIAGAFRLYQGGAGGIVGTIVIIVTSCVGLGWKYWIDKHHKPLNWITLYIFGVTVQLAMLSCMFLMPATMRSSIFRNIALPILLIYPVLTVIIGLILKKQEDRRTADRKLLYSNSLATAALESTPDGVLIVDLEGKIARWNQKFVDLWKVPPNLLDTTVKDPVLAHATSQMVNPDEFITKVVHLYQHPEETSSDTLQLADGRIFERYSQPQKIGNEIVGRFWSFRDVTDLKKSEEILRNSEAKFSAIFRTSPDSININRLEDAVFVDINEGFTAMFGYSAEEIIGKPSTETAVWVDVEDRALLARQIKEVGFVKNMETRLRRKDGSLLTALVSSRLIELDGELCTLNIARDITEHKLVEEEKQHLEIQMLHAQKLESLGVLAGGIAHDFNNLLMAIMGNADLALMRLSKESPAVDNIQKIEQATARAADLAKQMLAYSGKGKFVVEPHDINKLVEEMWHMLEVSISKKAVLRFNPYHPLPTVEVDATQIRQIIMNLVINASEAIGDKSGVIAVSTGCLECSEGYFQSAWLTDPIPEGLYVYLEITDTGCGMDKLTQEKIFDPFFTTKFTGRGLGMAAVLGIVRSHKGAIILNSELSKGTTFKILLPASERPVELFNGDSGHDDWHGEGTVMLVDDEETVRDIGAEMLKELGFKVITANDGREAVETYKNKPGIDIVILDLTMPHMDGEQCFRELRQHDPNVKVIMSSGFSEQEVAQKFAGKGLVGFIQKPYKMSVLKQAIQNI